MRTAVLAWLLVSALLVSIGGCASILGIEVLASGDAVEGGVDADAADAGIADAPPSED